METNTQPQLFVISALGSDRPGIVSALTEAVLETGCNIEDSRMTILGGEFAIVMMVSGPWNAIAKLEKLLPGLCNKLELQYSSKRTNSRSAATGEQPYMVEVVAIDHPGIVRQLTGFFAQHQINIHDLSTGKYHAAHTGTPMFTVHMAINVPGKVQLNLLREEFLELCDSLNLDAVMEPLKS